MLQVKERNQTDIMKEMHRYIWLYMIYKEYQELSFYFIKQYEYKLLFISGTAFMNNLNVETKIPAVLPIKLILKLS